VVQAIVESLQPFGPVRIRSWGDVTGMEPAQADRIAQHRPPDRIADPRQRAEAAAVRRRFAEDLSQAL